MSVYKISVGLMVSLFVVLALFKSQDERGPMAIAPEFGSPEYWQRIADAANLAHSAKTAANDIKNFAGEVTLANFDWRLEGFGALLSFDFAIANAKNTDVKDVVLDCAFHGQSGTEIARRKLTAFKKFTKGNVTKVKDFNAGFAPSQTHSISCAIAGFSRG